MKNISERVSAFRSKRTLFSVGIVPVADAEAVIPSLHDATDDGMCIFFVR